MNVVIEAAEATSTAPTTALSLSDWCWWQPSSSELISRNASPPKRSGYWQITWFCSVSMGFSRSRSFIQRMWQLQTSGLPETSKFRNCFHGSSSSRNVRMALSRRITFSIPEKAPSSSSASRRFDAITTVSRLVLAANAPDWMRCRFSAPEMDTLRRFDSPKKAPSGMISKSFWPRDSSSSRPSMLSATTTKGVEGQVDQHRAAYVEPAQVLQALERSGLNLVQRVQPQVQLGQEAQRPEGRCRDNVDRIVVQMENAQIGQPVERVRMQRADLVLAQVQLLQLGQRTEQALRHLLDEVAAQVQHTQLAHPRERLVADRRDLVVVQVQLQQPLLVHEDTFRHTQQMVVAQIEHRQLGVELDRRIDRLDAIELNHQPLDGGVQRDREHVQLSLATGHVQFHIITDTPGRAGCS
uniref:Uncharacterized protein n=1 Tax=Anopheles atroparvus TaxID=41427 RepID=A0A182J4S8_ANOAO